MKMKHVRSARRQKPAHYRSSMSACFVTAAKPLPSAGPAGTVTSTEFAQMLWKRVDVAGRFETLCRSNGYVDPAPLRGAVPDAVIVGGREAARVL